MNQKIMTVLGEFVVSLSWKPQGEDFILLKLTDCINQSALPMLQDGMAPDEVLKNLDEALLEEDLFNCLTVPGGAGQRLSLNLKRRSIELSNF